MELLFYIYLGLLLLLGIISYKSIKTYKDFVLAGAKQGTFNISLSLLASMIGGSATIGMLSLVQSKGFPAIWWLGSGAFFLILQGYFLASPVRSLNAYSLPHLARIVINPSASIYIASIICITWIGIIASQFIALEYLLALVLPSVNTDLSIGIVAFFVIIYTLLGGQHSIIKTDAVQFIILFLTIFSIFILAYFSNYFSNDAFVMLSPTEIINNLGAKFELFNPNFGFYDFIYIFLIVGLAYFVGPDIFSRNLSAKDARTAKISTYISAVLLFTFAIIMIYTALWLNNNISASGANALILFIQEHLPLPLAALLTLGLISALISSADTCLMSTATIISNDILQSKSLAKLRLIILFVGLLALGLAIYKNIFIALLLSSYAVYVPGVVVPLGSSIYFYQKKAQNTKLIMLAIVLGSGLGLLSTFLKIPSLSLYGLGFSALFSFLAYAPSFSSLKAMQKAR